MAFGEFEEAIEEAVGPFGGLWGKGEGEEGEEGAGAHGGAIGEGAGEGDVADVGGAGVPGEVDGLVHHVGGEDEVRFGAGLAEDGAIVTDAGEDAVAASDAEAVGAGVDAIDEVRFGQANIVELCCAPYC